MSNQLVERLEFRLTTKMKASVKRISKSYGVSLGEIIRMGVLALERIEIEKK